MIAAFLSANGGFLKAMLALHLTGRGAELRRRALEREYGDGSGEP